MYINFLGVRIMTDDSTLLTFDMEFQNVTQAITRC